jgi:dimeric dUTPase (all-alpha-NTP-PPase superfamily)
MNKLGEMVKEQREFQKNFFDIDTLSFPDRVSFTKENILSLHRELGEVLNEIPWKAHRKSNDVCDEEHVREELIDCLKFLLNLCIIWGMTEDDIYKQFVEKSKIVRERFDDEKGNIKGYGF